MILVDTSVWVEHFRRGSGLLRKLLTDGQVLCHPYVIGELACGNLHHRPKILGLLAALPQPAMAGQAEVLRLIESRGLHGQGLGWVDAHLLASALLTPCPLWTLDRRLREAASALGTAL